MQQLSAVDAMFTYTETSSTPMHIGQLAIYDPSTAPGGKVGFKDILGYIESRLDAARLFRQKLVMVPLNLDHPYWVNDENFDLEYHVRHVALPKPGDWRQLCILVSRIFARPLDMKRPLWEFTIIEGLDNVEGCPPGCFALLQKEHHSAMDGKSSLELTMALHDQAPGQVRQHIDHSWQPEADPGPFSLLSKAYINGLTNPLHAWNAIQKLVPAVMRVRALNKEDENNPKENTDVPVTRFNQSVSPHRIFAAKTFSLADIKTIRQAFPATVNDVMIAIVAGALRSYLADLGELPDHTLKTAVPISVRAETAAADGGNQISMMMTNLGTHISNAGERLVYIASHTKKSKIMSEAVGAQTIMDVSNAMPAGLLSAAITAALRMGLTNKLANTTITNVPGSPVKMYFANAELVTNWGIGFLVDGMGTFHTVTSYNGNVMLSVLADRQMMPNPHDYEEALGASFSELLAAARETLD